MGLHPLAEIGVPGTGPFLIGGGALGDRDQRAAGAPILQRRDLHLADLGTEFAQGRDCSVDARSEERRVGKEGRSQGIRDDLVTGVQTCALPISAAYEEWACTRSPKSACLVRAHSS